MASAFWILEDGRGLARRWRVLAYTLNLITSELKNIHGAEEFYVFLEKLVYREDMGDIENGYGGFIRQDENIMLDIDLRTYAPENRDFFWQATQSALHKLKKQQNNQHEIIEAQLIDLLKMHKCIKRGENPMLLTDLNVILPEPQKKIGPGW